MAQRNDRIPEIYIPLNKTVCLANKLAFLAANTKGFRI